MIISHSKKFIYFACGKTGTTSIEKVLKPYHDGDALYDLLKDRLEKKGKDFNPKHTRPEALREVFPADLWNEYFKFSFVRNPWDWVVSQYYFSNFKKTKWDLFTRKIHARHVEKVWRQKQAFNQVDTDSSYMQSSFVFGPNAEKLVNFFGCYERLQDDFDTVCQYLKIPSVELPVRNKTIHKPYQKLYTSKAKERVGRLYEKDIRLLGYRFNETPPKDSITRPSPLFH